MFIQTSYHELWLHPRLKAAVTAHHRGGSEGGGDSSSLELTLRVFGQVQIFGK